MAAALLPDALWDLVEPFLPIPSLRPRGGRPRVSDRACLTGIVFVLRSGIPWQMLPQELECGSGMTCWRRLRDWQRAGVWDLIHFALLDWLARSDQIDWSRAVVDSCSIRAVCGGDQTGPNLTDRAKHGSKRHLICDGRGVPLAVRLTGANRNDSQEALALVDGIPRCTANGDARGSDRTVCSGIAATTQPPFGAVSGRVTSCRCWPSAAPSMGVAWAGGAGSWSAHLPGSVSFAACACGMTSGPTSTRRSSRSAARWSAGSSCEKRVDDGLSAGLFLLCRPGVHY
jgi:transposase